jgi:lipopolysaccharide transport system permease protein
VTEPEIVLEPGRLQARYWRDVWEYRELLYFLAWRDISVRYKQTALGLLWAVGRPLLATLILTVVFGRLARLPSDGTPYSILVLAGLLPWLFFASAVTDCSNSLVSNASLISKVYFPRLIAPASVVLVSLVDLAVSLVILVGLMAWYGSWPRWQRVGMMPVSLLLAGATALGAGLWLAALNVRYRDVRHVVPFAIQLGVYVSPVGFASDLVPAHWRPYYALNPLVGVIDTFRWSLLPGDRAMPWFNVAVACIVTAGLLLSGLTYFRRTERTFADVV